jgi:hypothetical protein
MVQTVPQDIFGDSHIKKLCDWQQWRLPPVLDESAGYLHRHTQGFSSAKKL